MIKLKGKLLKVEDREFEGRKYKMANFLYQGEFVKLGVKEGITVPDINTHIGKEVELLVSIKGGQYNKASFTIQEIN